MGQASANRLLGSGLSPVSPASLFNMADPLTSAIFDGCRFVWEPLSDLADRIQGSLGANSVVRGIVMPGAVVSERGVMIEEGAIVETGAYVKGPCIIRRNAEVRHGAYIRGSVLLMEGAVLGHASEAKNSILLRDAKAPHFAYVGDSILGARVNLGAGTKLSNLAMTSERDKVTGRRPSITLRVDDVVYDTGLAKFGAVLGDDCETGCNSVLNPGVIVGPRSLVYPNVSVRRGYYPADTIMKLRQHVEYVQRVRR